MAELTTLQQGLESLKAQKVDEAVAYLEKATDESPQDYRAFSYLGIAYAQKGLHNRAISAFQTALHLQPGIPSIHYNLGLAFQNDGMLHMAKEEFAHALELDPNYHKAAEAIKVIDASMNAEHASTGRSCARHPDEESIGQCSVCRLDICRKCKTVVDGVTYCSNCAPK